MSELVIEYTFGQKHHSLRPLLSSFWKDNISAYHQEMNTYLPEGKTFQSNSASQSLLSRSPAAIVRDKGGKLVGIVFVALRSLNTELNLGTHAYFQRMYIIKSFRNASLAYRLNQKFMEGFIPAKRTRDHRADNLIIEISNPRLQNSFTRKYLNRLGFRMLGTNTLNEEIWHLPLETTFNM